MMQKSKSSFGYAMILWIVGTFPIVFDAIFRAFINKDGSLNAYEFFLIAVCYLIGGLLCMYIANKECNVKIKEHNWKINKKSLLLTVAFSIAYITSIFGTLRREELESLYGLNEWVPWQIFVPATIIAPWGEEMIYRYSIFSVLKGNDKRLWKLILAIAVSSIIFMIMHFNGGIFRITELLLFGVVSAIIFHFTNNLLYCVVFHATANLVIYSFCDIYQIVKFHNIILLFSIPFAVLCFVLLISDCTRLKNNEIQSKDECFSCDTTA